MLISPFPHHGPLAAEQVRGRDDLLDDLIERVSTRRVTALLGPRRFGKTSALNRLDADLRAGGTSVVRLDLYEVSGWADLARRFDAGLSGASGPVRSRLQEIAVGIRLHLGMVSAELSRPPSQRPDASATFASLVDVLVEAALAEPTVVIIDEFPGIDRVDGAAGLLRTRLQHHFQDVGLLFAGSQPTLMRLMFADQHRPFYAQADLVEIQRFPPPVVHEIVTEGFTTTGKDATEVVGPIAELTDGHPYRLMQAADAAWHADGRWAPALTHLRAAVGPAMETAFTHRSPADQSVLRLLAHGDGLYGAAADGLGLAPGSARRAVERLRDMGEVEVRDDRTTIVDPLLADWLRLRFPR